MGPNSTLCQICERIVFDDATGDAVANAEGAEPWALTDTWPDLPFLWGSAAAGCTFCGYIASILKEGKIPTAKAALSKAAHGSRIRVTIRKPGYVRRSDIVDLIPGWEHVGRREEPDGICWLGLEVSCEGFDQGWVTRAWVYRGASDVVSGHLGIEMSKPAAHVLDPGCLDQIQEWLRDCESSHRQCQLRETARLPTRLIDIGTSSSATPRLVNSSSLPPSSRYFALSYCWGPPSEAKPQLTTTRATLAARRAGIPPSTMPPTMRDFVALAHRLGVRYLWVDAVCIVQDDAAQWEHEASLMYSVYRHASLTVAAAAGPTSHSGFLRRRPTRHAVVPFTSRRSGAGAGAGVRGDYLLYHLNEYRSWDADNPAHLHRTAWVTRAWTLQEDVLSTRVLYFDGETSYFRCQAARRAEHGALSHEPMLRWHDVLTPRATTDDGGGGPGGPGGAAEARAALYDRWDLLLAEYSERGLAFGADKFPALSGLARGFAAALADEYVAGMWRGDLLHGLLWYTYRDWRAPAGAGWRAPSWSWAAADGCVGTMAHSRPVVARASLEEVRVVPRGVDPFGALADAWIVVAGPARPVVLRPSAERHGRGIAHADVVDRESGAVVAYGTVDSVTHSGLENDETYVPADTGRFRAMKRVRALLLCLVPTSEVAEDGETMAASEPKYPVGILVEPAGGGDAAGAPCYKRIGMFRTDETDDLGAWEGLPRARIRLV